MEIKKVWVKASCAAGWSMGVKFSDAVRGMVRHSRGYVDPENMSLSEFLEQVDDQRISLMLVEQKVDEEGRPKYPDFGCLGDNFNEAKVFSDGNGGEGAAK